MGRRPSLFRGGSLLVLVGVIFAVGNMVLMWSQLHQMQTAVGVPPSSGAQGLGGCNCEGVRDVRGTVVSIGHNTSTVPPALHNISSTMKMNPPRPQSVSEVVVKPSASSDGHKLAVVVPFRNRFEEMMEFVPHIHAFLQRQNKAHRILVINQVDSHRFNRAALLNIGFLLSKNECDYMVMHDIDLLPISDDLIYQFPSEGPFHVSSPELHPLYHYKTFVGGILIMSRQQFEKVNGLSNLFWGWGREDDELYVRMKEAGMTVHYPQGITTGYNTFRHIHDKDRRPRDQKRFLNQKEMSRRRDRKTGADSVKYRIVSNLEMTISGAPLNFVNVELECDYNITPFCDNPS